MQYIYQNKYTQFPGNILSANINPSYSITDGDSVAGQRVATILVYLTSLSPDQGGATLFRDLPDPQTGKPPLRVQPKQGNAVLFFPAAGGIPSTPLDIRTLHCGEVVGASEDDDKWYKFQDTCVTLVRDTTSTASTRTVL